MSEKYEKLKTREEIDEIVRKVKREAFFHTARRVVFLIALTGICIWLIYLIKSS